MSAKGLKTEKVNAISSPLAVSVSVAKGRWGSMQHLVAHIFKSDDKHLANHGVSTLRDTNSVVNGVTRASTT